MKDFTTHKLSSILPELHIIQSSRRLPGTSAVKRAMCQLLCEMTCFGVLTNTNGLRPKNG